MINPETKSCLEPGTDALVQSQKKLEYKILPTMKHCIPQNWVIKVYDVQLVHDNIHLLLELTNGRSRSELFAS